MIDGPDAAATAPRRCPICGDAARGAALIGTLATTVPVELERPSYELVECRSCELIYLSPAPSDRDLHSMYVDGIQFGDAVYTDPERVRAIVGYMTECLERMQKRARRDVDEPIAILEVGAGLAWMCRAAKALNPQNATTAQDISPEAALSCAWVDRYVQDDIFASAITERAPYHVISLTHVIEHLVDPVGVIRRCRALLGTGGVIFITAPHRPVGWKSRAPDVALWRDYSYNHVPAHTQYFSKASMRALADRTGCVLDHWSHAHEDGQAFEAWLRTA